MFTAKVVRKRHKMIRPPRHGVYAKVGLFGEEAEKAMLNEFGTKSIPERPFIRHAMLENRDSYRRALKIGAQMILRGETSMEAIVQRLGERAEADIRGMIDALRTPPNTESTLASKQGSNPLIDEGQMKAAVRSKLTRR